MSACASGPTDSLTSTRDDDDDAAVPPFSAQGSSSTPVVPIRRTFFDPWNSSSTGHQRAENRLSGSTAWRASRSSKLGEQYRAGLTGGGKRLADTVGAGSPDFGKEGRKENGDWERGAKGLRTGGQTSLIDVWRATKAGKKAVVDKQSAQDAPAVEDAHSTAPENPIFKGLCFFVNGSTAPHVSDHKLKHLLSAHGGRHSIALGRRTVTHVVLGTASAKGGCGGGLAATKMQKEVARTGGKTIRYVTVEWVLESIKAGRRLPESRFAPLKLAHKSQAIAFGILNRDDATGFAHG
ncbi:hypothetical protein E8E13_000726 [Curvularia kusanoi]|uniref:BRCT domain-containing protein n=1 Tax=Curvularia kusanoi TaxID=90978 RepID=A0A9P4W1K7_CURKU|nr:hypothetical protein E8E13_000726 [Curvularia kusanoi]